ncbi:Epoxide hydrolase-like [Fusarium oxysporum f. sp. vasinfectum]|nr:Epoxide hydrolase-like [Fusarium oxysporum f. sp. vasinfectum]
MPSQDFTQIPVIDISSPTPQTLSNLRTALTEIGFLYISNHSGNDFFDLLLKLLIFRKRSSSHTFLINIVLNWFTTRLQQPHPKASVLTKIPQDGGPSSSKHPPQVNGLQVLNKSGSWIDVPAIPDTFVVNIGQAFEVVTNGYINMALELPARQKFTAHSGNVYSCIFIPPTAQSTTLLFLHGFPSTLTDWVHQIQHFSSEGYGVVALDLLGYGASSKPTDVNAYRLKPMSDEVIELLDHLDLKTVVGIGHDFGATLLSRMAAYHPSRWEALVFLAVGPPRLGTPFDVDMINTMTKQFLGYEMLGYVPWLADYRSQELLEKNAEATMSLMFCRDREEWETWFHPVGKMEEFVREDRRLPIALWYTEDLQKAHLKAFGSHDGYKGVCRWYRMWKDNLFAPDEQGFEDFHISQPVLFIVPSEPEQSAAQQQQMLSSWTPNLQTVKLNTSHWIHIQAPSETNTTIQNFLTSRRET